MKHLLKIAISAGELSGDEHAAALLSALNKFHENIECRGMGGSNLRAAGIETVVDSEQSASVMGFGELLGSLGNILQALKDMKQLLSDWKPDLLILVDYPDFNLRLAKYAKSLGIPVFYYITPTVWAWRTGRIKLFKKFVNHAAVIFPFEREFFEKHKYLRSVYVGHPLVDEMQRQTLSEEKKIALCNHLGLDEAKKTVAILPGSRWKEVRTHLRHMLDGFSLLQKEHPDIQAVIPIAPNIEAERLKALLPANLDIALTNQAAIKVMQCADAGILKSGTSNLQAAFCGLPFAMFFIGGRFTEFIVTKFVRIKEYSPVNIIRPRTVVEMIQKEANKNNIAKELERLLFDDDYRKVMKYNLESIVKSLSSYDKNPLFEQCNSTAERTAKLVLTMV